MKSILKWENPKKTICFLIAFNVGFLIFRAMQISFISLVLHGALIAIIVDIVKRNLNSQKSNLCTLKKETIESIYLMLYTKINAYLDKLRKIIYLENKSSLIRSMIVSLSLITFGKYFSSLSMLVIMFDMYTVLCYGTLREQMKTKMEKVLEVASKIMTDKIPKYEGN